MVRTIIALLVYCLLTCSAQAAGDALTREAKWRLPEPEAAIAMLTTALEQQLVEPPLIEQAVELFSAALDSDVDRLDAFVRAARRVVPVVDQLLTDYDALSEERLQDRLSKINRELRQPIRVYLGRALVRKRLFDEALPLLADVDFQNCLDPAALLFFRAACNHALLKKEAALEDLGIMLENDEDCPVRYARTARLMLTDIQPLKEDSLDEISRLMSDVERRLDLGRADEKVQEQEQAIIDKLTKLIDKIEEQQQQQQQQQQQSSAGGDGRGGQASPMQDSQAAGGGGASGDVDKRDLANRQDWGKLPPAERQEALQNIGRDLPTHYRDTIEAYFRKLATDK